MFVYTKPEFTFSIILSRRFASKYMFLVLRKPFLCESKTNTAEEKLLSNKSTSNHFPF